MLLESENGKPVDSPTLKQIESTLDRVKSSFCSLTSSDGSYLQAAGGPELFLLEFKDKFGNHFRAQRETPCTPFPDGTALMFSAGSVPMSALDWLRKSDVKAAFEDFSHANERLSSLAWVSLSSDYRPAS